MKVNVCCVCGTKLKRKKGIGPVCEGKVGSGPNEHKAQFARKQFTKTAYEARKMGILIGYDFDAKEFFCFPVEHPKPPSLDQELKMNLLEKYFYQAVYHSLSGPEQHELVQRLYEDKPSSDEV